nr:RelA/SpoT family protein [uncultured Treponema sp.]
MEEKALPENPQVLIDDFFKRFDFYADEKKDKIIKAWDYLIEKTESLTRDDGTKFYLHPYRVAVIIAGFELDADSVVIALLHDLLSLENIEESEVEQKFGPEIFNLIKNIEKVSNVHFSESTLNHADAVRNMYFALAVDMRVIIIKLADRIDYMRYIRYKDEHTQKVVSQEILEIWAPLADRLGIKQGKNELEDLTLKYLHPDAFLQIKSIVSQKKDERAEYLEKTKQALYKAANRAGIEVQISSRAKHFFSIYQKMRKRNKEPGELYDLLAMRILCNSNAECYQMLGIVHNLWKPLEGRFKDYIAMPKANGYQSLHTTVMAEGKPLEVQIRTNEMHNIAEHGIASHWLYKKGTNKDNVDVKDLPIVNQLQQLCEDSMSDEALYTEFKDNLLKDKIVVFTPNGDVIQLPQGATAVDFAYAIHTHIGETIASAKADGRIIQLSTPLKNTQIIEIITSPQNHPTENQLSYVVTYKAKSKIHAWLQANGAEAKPVPKTEEEDSQKEKQPHKKGKGKKEKQTVHSGKIRIENTTNFVMTLAGCCSPKYPDEIVGYVSRARGITIHRADCYIYKRIPNADLRSVDVEWDEL